MWDYVLLELRKRDESVVILPDGAESGAGTGIYVAAIGDKKLMPDGTIVSVQELPFKVGDEVQASTEGMVKIQMPKKVGESDGRRFIICRPERIVCIINPGAFGPHQ